MSIQPCMPFQQSIYFKLYLERKFTGMALDTKIADYGRVVASFCDERSSGVLIEVRISPEGMVQFIEDSGDRVLDGDVKLSTTYAMLREIVQKLHWEPEFGYRLKRDDWTEQDDVHDLGNLIWHKLIEADRFGGLVAPVTTVSKNNTPYKITIEPYKKEKPYQHLFGLQLNWPIRKYKSKSDKPAPYSDKSTMRIEQATGNLGERAILFDLIPRPKDTLGEKLLKGFRTLWNVPEDMHTDLKIAMNYAYQEGKAVGVRDTKEAVQKVLNQ